MPELPRLLVTGATGKQGGALISALLTKAAPRFEIYALTRDKNSAKAQALAKQPNVRIVQGDFDHPVEIFKQVEKPWGVFSVTMPMNPKKEEQQGKAMTAAAVAAGVKHIVFTSTERGGQSKSDNNPTPVPHFVSKYNIERDIMAKAQANNFTWTFLRPVAFLDNLTNNFFGRAFVSMWKLNGEDFKMQVIGTKDIGLVAADAFLNAETDDYRNKSVSLAGNELYITEAAEIFKDTTGQELDSTYLWMARLLKWILHEHLGIMFDWMKSDGFGVEMSAMKRRYPFMQDFKTWVREESAWRKQ